MDLQFGAPLSIPFVDDDGNVYVYEGCYVKSVTIEYPKDGPLVVEDANVEPPEVQDTDAGSP